MELMSTHGQDQVSGCSEPGRRFLKRSDPGAARPQANIRLTGVGTKLIISAVGIPCLWRIRSLAALSRGAGSMLPGDSFVSRTFDSHCQLSRSPTPSRRPTSSSPSGLCQTASDAPDAVCRAADPTAATSCSAVAGPRADVLGISVVWSDKDTTRIAPWAHATTIGCVVRR